MACVAVRGQQHGLSGCEGGGPSGVCSDMAMKLQGGQQCGPGSCEGGGDMAYAAARRWRRGVCGSKGHGELLAHTVSRGSMR